MIIFFATLFLCFHVQAQTSLQIEYQEGEYLARAGGCHDCHTVTLDRYMAGGLALPTPFGTFYTPNITPSVGSGIGGWTLNNFRTALRDGTAPDGWPYYPSFPYRSFTKIRDEDVRKIWVYLLGQKAIESVDWPQELRFPYNMRYLIKGWQWWYMKGETVNVELDQRISRGPFREDPAQTPEWNRGAYLTEALLHCTECHTPRNIMGALDPKLWMAGSNLEVDNMRVPNITPDPETGTGLWTNDDWTRFLSAGLTPRGTYVGGEMARVIQNTAGLTIKDRAAVVEYLRSLKPVRRWPSAKR